MKTYSLGFSPCPNDTFIFYALVRGRLNHCKLRFREMLADVETLNQMAFRRELEVTKLSYHAFAHLVDDYVLLKSGSALGRGCGPLLISHRSCPPEELQDKKIAIPGKYTTAAMLLKLYGEYHNVVEMGFEKIIPAVKMGMVDAGVIIHESRFTYEKEGLVRIVDLGHWWEETTGLPVPLGGIFARRDLGTEELAAVDSCLEESIQYAFSHREEPMDYIRNHAQELEDDVIKKHVNLYVNSFTLDIGEEGVQAVRYMLKMGYDKGLFKRYREDFVVG
ncbi:MAG TPA: 1,4-dihydroxy-6-naphthoate synthase [Proteobacteria bacterium]|nr:1,4-dihydroxy-6-naphthoate synthase [Pseudomonadota bacterium]